MTRKKIYICFALLFCAPTALFSAQNQKWVLVEIKTDSKVDAVFAITEMTGNEIYKLLKSKNEGYPKSRGAIEKLSLSLYWAENESDKTMTIWGKDIKNGNQNKALEPIRFKSYCVSEEKKLGITLAPWLGKQIREQEQSTNEDASIASENNKVWIIDKSESGYKLGPIYLLTVDINQEETFVIAGKEDFGNLTIKNIRQKIKEQGGPEPEKQKIFENSKGNKIELNNDNSTLNEYKIKGPQVRLSVVTRENTENGNLSGISDAKGGGKNNNQKDGDKPLYTNPKFMSFFIIVILLAAFLALRLTGNRENQKK